MTNSNKSVKRINVGEHETCIFGIGLSYGILSKLSEMQLEEPIIRSIEFCKNLSDFCLCHGGIIYVLAEKRYAIHK